LHAAFDVAGAGNVAFAGAPVLDPTDAPPQTVFLCDKTRPSRKKPLSAEVKLKVLTTTMQPPPNATHWSTRSMARVVGISHSSVHRIWREADLKPHLVRTFKVSFADNVTDVVGLYMNQPEGAGAMRGREEPDPGPRPRTVGPALVEGPGGHNDPRL
jgi:hypothetical protein